MHQVLLRHRYLLIGINSRLAEASASSNIGRKRVYQLRLAEANKMRGSICRWTCEMSGSVGRIVRLETKVNLYEGYSTVYGLEIVVLVIMVIIIGIIFIIIIIIIIIVIISF
jgi:hypothetical protein